MFGRGGCRAERDVAALDHEARHEPVEWSVIVRAACAESEEVLFACCFRLFFLAPQGVWGDGGIYLCGFWNGFAKDFNL